MKKNRKCVLALIDESIPIGEMGRVTFYNKITMLWGDIKQASEMALDEAELFKKDLDIVVKRANGYLSINIQFA